MEDMNTPVNSLYTWVMAGACLFLFAFSWYACNTFIQAFIEVQTTQYGSYFDATTDAFLTNLWTYLPFIVVIAILIAVIVQSQKERAQQMIYG